MSASQVLALLDHDSEAIPRSQDHLSYDDHLVALVDRRDAKVTQEGSQDDLLFHQRKPLSDAVARSCAEGDEGKRMTTDAVLRQKALRIEALRVIVH